MKLSHTAITISDSDLMKKEPYCSTTRSSIGQSLHCSIFLVLTATLSAAPPPELITVQQQYEKAVLGPHVAEKAALDSKFIAALTNAATAAKQAGHLDEVLAIRADQKRLTEKLPIPDDDAGIPESLKKLRGIYREQLTRIESQRTANHTAMLPDYMGKLKDLEIHLTRSDRIEEAMEVKAYRESLANGAPPVAGTNTLPPPAPASKMANTTKTSGPKGDDRAAAEWLLSGDDILVEKARKRWVEVNGNWSFADGKLTGSGDSRINYVARIRVPFVLTYDFEVKEGMRPRVFIGDAYRIANEGYKNQVDLYPQAKTEPIPYELKRKYSVKFVVNRRFIEFYLDGKLITRRDVGLEEDPELLGFCGGDGYSPGITEFSNIRLD